LSDGGEPRRHEARLAARRAGSPLVVVTLELPAPVIASHQVPGQYVSIAAEGDDGFFVLASPVGAPAWQLLVRGGGTVADALLAKPIGTILATSGALGTGFPCADARRRRLAICAAGTGIAAAPPLAERRIQDGDAHRTHIYLGLRSAAELPCPEDVVRWRAAGVMVTICVSREEARAPFTERGYVQDIARAHFAIEPGASASMLLFAVGPAPMVEGARALAKSLGIAEIDFRTNY